MHDINKSIQIPKRILGENISFPGDIPFEAFFASPPLKMAAPGIPVLQGQLRRTSHRFAGRRGTAGPALRRSWSVDDARRWRDGRKGQQSMASIVLAERTQFRLMKSTGPREPSAAKARLRRYELQMGAITVATRFAQGKGALVDVPE